MIRRAAGALIGAEIDRVKGGGGLRGAVLGTVAMAAMRRMGPWGYAVGAAWAAKQAYDRRKAARS